MTEHCGGKSTIGREDGSDDNVPIGVVRLYWRDPVRRGNEYGPRYSQFKGNVPDVDRFAVGIVEFLREAVPSRKARTQPSVRRRDEELTMNFSRPQESWCTEPRRGAAFIG